MQVSKKLIAQRVFAEFLCSCIFGFAVYSAILNTKSEDVSVSGTTIGLTIGFSGIALIYTFADHSVAHFNPAITISTILTGKIEIAMGICYVCAQLIGFLVASLLVVVCFPYGYSETLELITPAKVTEDLSTTSLFFTEFILSFILVFVVFEVGINAVREPGVTLFIGEPQKDRSILAPLTIGLTLGFLGFLASTTSGGAFNPGIVFGPAILGSNYSDFWVYIVSELTGGLLGALVQVFLLFK